MTLIWIIILWLVMFAILKLIVVTSEIVGWTTAWIQIHDLLQARREQLTSEERSAVMDLLIEVKQPRNFVSDVLDRLAARRGLKP